MAATLPISMSAYELEMLIGELSRSFNHGQCGRDEDAVIEICDRLEYAEKYGFADDEDYVFKAEKGLDEVEGSLVRLVSGHPRILPGRCANRAPLALECIRRARRYRQRVAACIDKAQHHDLFDRGISGPENRQVKEASRGSEGMIAASTRRRHR